MQKLFLILIFFIPFQARFYKALKPLSLSWMDPSWQLPLFFEPLADLYISDLLLVLLGVWAVFQKKLELYFVRLKKLLLGCVKVPGLRLSKRGVVLEKYNPTLRQLNRGSFHINLKATFSTERGMEKLLTVFLGVALLSIVISDYRSYPLSYWRWAHLALPALMVYAWRSWAVSLKTIASVVVLSASLECAIAIPQYLMQHQIGLKMMGEPTLVSKHVTAPHFLMPKKAVTSIDYVFSQSEEPALVLRASGTLPHPNVLGGFLVFSLFMTCFLYEQSARKGWIGGAFILQIVTLFMSYSRSALFAFAGAMTLWLLFHYLKEKKMAATWKPLTLGFALAVLLLFPQLFHRGGVVTYNALAAKSDEMRLSMQNVASLIIADNSWLGVGFNHYLIAFAKYTQGSSVEAISVHNIYMLIGAETGLIGLACFLLFCGWIVYRGWQQRASLEGRTLLALFLAFLAIGCVDYYPIVLQQTRLIFFLTAGLVILFSHSSVVNNHLDNTDPALSRS